MPIYEYQSKDPNQSCEYCLDSFEVLQGIKDPPISRCPACGNGVKKIISWCRAAVVESAESDAMVERTVREYERAGMWSHAAELADKHAEKTKDQSLKTRALENYTKAGHRVDNLVEGGW